MGRFIFRRLLGLIPTLLVIIILSFMVIRMAPGSPFSTERAIPPEVLADLEARYGFGDSWPTQMWNYVKNLSSRRFGDYPRNILSAL